MQNQGSKIKHVDEKKSRHEKKLDVEKNQGMKKKKLDVEKIQAWKKHRKSAKLPWHHNFELPFSHGHIHGYGHGLEVSRNVWSYSPVMIVGRWLLVIGH